MCLCPTKSLTKLPTLLKPRPVPSLPAQSSGQRVLSLTLVCCAPWWRLAIQDGCATQAGRHNQAPGASTLDLTKHHLYSRKPSFSGKTERGKHFCFPIPDTANHWPSLFVLCLLHCEVGIPVPFLIGEEAEVWVSAVSVQGPELLMEMLPAKLLHSCSTL